MAEESSPKEEIKTGEDTGDKSQEKPTGESDDKSTDYSKPKERTKEEIEEEVKGMSAEEAERVRAALHKANTEARDRRLELQKYTELGVDPDTVAQWKKEREEAEIQRLEEERNFTELQERLKNSYEEKLEKERGKLSEYEQKVETYRKNMESILVDNEALRVLQEMGGDPELVLHKLKNDVQVVQNDLGDMEVQILDSNKQPKTKDDGSKFTIKDYFSELREHPSYGKAFAAPVVSGGGSKTDTTGDKGGDGPGKPPKMYKNEMSVKELQDFAAKYGHEELRKLPRKRPGRKS